MPRIGGRYLPMCKSITLLLATGLLALTGCQKYVAIPNSTADRIWMITQDGG